MFSSELVLRYSQFMDCGLVVTRAEVFNPEDGSHTFL
jgi:hypothetical protein